LVTEQGEFLTARPVSEHSIWYNGALQNSLLFSGEDPGWLYGATAFTTLRVYGRSLNHPHTAWPLHLERLQKALHAFHWIEPDWPRLRQGAEVLSQTFPILRLTIFPDGRECVLGRNLPPKLSHWQQQGIVAWIAAGDLYQRWQPSYKTGNYLAAWLAKQHALQQGAEEAILLDAKGCWLETSTGNLLGWGGDRWWTPPLGANLAGIMRTQILAGLRSQGETVQEVPWTPAVIAQFEVIIHCNSGSQIVPIVQVLPQHPTPIYPPGHAAIAQLRTFFH
jgi:4-amino-4-deoxychorismate lyase